jgi:formate dehydrogenase major subunit
MLPARGPPRFRGADQRECMQCVVIGRRRGEITLKARADRETAEGILFFPFAFAEAPLNALTNPQVDPMGKIPGPKFGDCDVGRVAPPTLE